MTHGGSQASGQTTHGAASQNPFYTCSWRRPRACAILRSNIPALPVLLVRINLFEEPGAQLVE